MTGTALTRRPLEMSNRFASRRIIHILATVAER